MKIADLYIRVSTDEQADKGYSQRSQEELLRKYCEINRIAIRQVIFEDHSAKTFNRPEWKKYLLDLRKRKGQSDLVLFIKWDRFSRNAGDAYQMINTLRKLGVEPQAIEQPLDLSIPENKMMLAFYLAAPEVENDRRALNVIAGMRRAKKEGRYMGLAPIGYINKSDQSGKKFIAQEEPQAGIMRWAFETLSEAHYNTEQIFKAAKEKGMRGTKNTFWAAIRNPLYCGKIFIPKYKNEESHFVTGKHEPLISQELFYKVQHILDSRKKHFLPKVVSNEHLPLRGFLSCNMPDCGRILTGSVSKGRSIYYGYYHCSRGCPNPKKPCRLRSELVNELFVTMLSEYRPRPEMTEIFKYTIIESWAKQTGQSMDEQKKTREQASKLEEEILYVRELLLSRQIEPDDYNKINEKLKSKKESLQMKLSSFDQEADPAISRLLDKGAKRLLKPDVLYNMSHIEIKRQIIKHIFSTNLVFSKTNGLKGQVNKAVDLIYTPKSSSAISLQEG